MKIFPAIDLYEGQAVQAVSGAIINQMTVYATIIRLQVARRLVQAERCPVSASGGSGRVRKAGAAANLAVDCVLLVEE